MLQVLLIDDDEKLAELLTQYCAGFDIAVDASFRPSLGLEKLARNPYDAVILDVMLPEKNGFDVCREIRAGESPKSAIPLLMLTARGDVTDRVVGLEIGADDYLPKPFEPRELVARLNTIVRRKQLPEAPSDVLKFEGIEVRLHSREVLIDAKPIDLTTMEYQLITLLCQSPGKDFTRDEILATLKGTDLELFSRSVDILVSRLRNKLKPAKPIKTVYGSGYAWVAKAQS